MIVLGRKEIDVGICEVFIDGEHISKTLGSVRMIVNKSHILSPSRNSWFTTKTKAE